VDRLPKNMKIKFPAVMLLCAFAFSAFADALIDSINQDGFPSPLSRWMAAEIGWKYTPTVNYALTGVFTEFSAIPYGDNRTVTVEVYDGLPSDGGRLLRSADFTPLAETYSGASFLPLNLLAGHAYFIGFRNVAHLGINVTANPEATVLYPLYYSLDNDDSYSFIETVTDNNSSNPILEFYGGNSLTPNEEVNQLISVVEATSMSKTKKALLSSILFQAERAFNRDNAVLGTKLLKVFQNQVRLHIARSDSTDADWFIELAQEIIDTVGTQKCQQKCQQTQSVGSKIEFKKVGLSYP
jgi:hypothetical protein